MSTTTSTPLISIVIPTRDRPEFACLALDSVRQQSFQDFELILSDNSLSRPMVPDPRTFDGVRVRYVRPPAPVWMTDHYEFAVSQARGRYVGILGDKSLLVRGALEQIAAEIRTGSPDSISWRIAGFRPAGPDLAGPGVVTLKRAESEQVVNVSPAEALDYLLATYLAPDFEADHQLEIRGSIYHGVFSSQLIESVKARFGRLFRYYAPDLNAQCVAMQVAKTVRHINRPLELVLSGPSNGVDICISAAQSLRTQADAARGPAGLSPPIIPGVSASIAHRLASDLVALSDRQLTPQQKAEVHRKAAFDLYRMDGWPEQAFRRSQVRALWASASTLDREMRRLVLREKWSARRSKGRALLARQLRPRFGAAIDHFREVLDRGKRSSERRYVEYLSAAVSGEQL